MGNKSRQLILLSNSDSSLSTKLIKNCKFKKVVGRDWSLQQKVRKQDRNYLLMWATVSNGYHHSFI